ncbi:MAG TPA: hypothetical protein VK158_06905 [Acidobacteriota bacterium]|nr:hypothetical protein [Acidobacteriota bacterium]
MTKYLKPLLLAGGLAAWYIHSSPSQLQLSQKTEYPLPEQITVTHTTLPYHTKEKLETIVVNGEFQTKTTQQKVVYTKDIPFGNDAFEIQTDRYRFVKDDDWLPSRAVGQTMSMFSRLFFWDWNIGWGLDASRTRAALAMVENDKSVKDLTVRVNHNEAFYDMYRMLVSDDKLKERNNFFARWTLGVVTGVFDEVWAEFKRGDYYNPMTNTMVVYSNLESVTAHELGHNKDFKQYDSDWLYMLGRVLPPVMLYQEWVASQNAKLSLTKEDQWQFNRYLIPAFATYVLATYQMLKKKKSKKDDKEIVDRRTTF